jgi:energy-coupling factor transporter ATP-binding protein EcfA2
MMAETRQPESVLRAILNWSETRPSWLRDALRRVVQQDAVSEEDAAELLNICKAERGLAVAAQQKPKAVPLTRSHLPATPPTSEAVSLSFITDVQSVNLLAPDQTLAFKPTGLTVIYGDNGSGKSGYARILKRACRARSRGGSIQSNIYAPATGLTPAAKLGFQVGGEDRDVQWRDDADAPEADLSAVSVFDADCAAVHVENKNEVAFRPFGLDVPDKLAAICRSLKKTLQDEKKAVEAKQPSVFQDPKWNPTTAVGRLLSRLRHDSNYDAIKKLARLSNQEEQRLAQLREDLAKNPASAAKELRLRIGRLKKLVAHVELSEATVSNEALANLTKLVAEAKDKREAAKVAAEKLFSGEPLTGVGSETWRELWDSSRKYSEKAAYRNQAFPATGENARCLLCQQVLNEEAANRLRRFEDFVKADIEKKAKDSLASAMAAWRTLEEASLRDASSRQSLQQLSLEDESLAKSTRLFLVLAALRKRHILRHLKTERDHPALVALPESPRKRLDASIETADRRAKELEKAAVDAARKKLESECQELNDRELLAGMLEAVLTEIGRLAELNALDKCIAETSTTAITNLGNELAEQVLTPQLRDRFADELIRLAENRVRAELTYAGGRYGTPQYQVKLIAKPQANVAQVLSEGENTCVALAGFLTELATAVHRSALVFDDPVCSLDHKWRLKVAKRLVKEAASRQIIVFTHDIVFVHDLHDRAQIASVSCELRNVRRDSTGAGVVGDGLPWIGMRVEHRLDDLGKRARVAGKLHEAGEDEQYGRQVSAIYSDLRATWERGIEDVVFQRTVVRHRDYIDTKNFKKVSVLTEADCDEFRKHFKRCCEVVSSHDPSAARNPETPPPTEMLDDIRALEDWVASLRDRQKAFAT